MTPARLAKHSRSKSVKFVYFRDEINQCLEDVHELDYYGLPARYVTQH